MKTYSFSIHDVLSKNAVSFFIPPFQRAYAWGRPEIERFFYDVRRIIESELDSNQKDKLEHFFGTLVLKEETEGFSTRWLIIDGQQRLTTVLLFLIALRDLEANERNKELITSTYLVNPSSDFQDKIKLKQVTKDWDAYRALIKGEKPVPGNITRAYELLKRLIIEYHKSNQELTIEHYIKAIQRLNVAVIFLDERPFKGEDPQVIFETLNSLGRPLTLSDLVRNYILLGLRSNDQTEVYDNIWYPKIEKVLEDDTSYFFRDYLQYKKSTYLKVVSDNNTKELYQEFKEFVKNEFGERVLDFVSDITKYVKLYKWIIREKYDSDDVISSNSKYDIEIKELLRNIFHDIESEAFKPFVLGLLEYHQYPRGDIRISDEMLISILKTIRTYLIRRRVLKLTQGENKSIVTLCKRIEDIAQGKVSVIEILTNLSYNLRFPNDDEIENALKSMNFYEELKDYAKFILGKIEENNSKVTVNFRSDKVTIEHIMPQKLSEEWKKELGANWEEVHKKYLHNIGNLILTEFNEEMGNKSFAEKKKRLMASNLSYRLSIINEDTWNEESIIRHQDRMIKWFLETFPLPDEYKHSNNWKTSTESSEVEGEYIFPLDNEDRNVRFTKPLEIITRGKSVKVDTWVDVFLKFMKYIYDSPEYDFDIIMDNQKELFGNSDTIVRWAKLKDMIEDDPDSCWKDYRTLDGKTYQEVDRIDSETLFINVNMSARRCLRRISSVMEKLNMESEEVKIRIKSAEGKKELPNLF
jgi:uncharacterized protein with ParB-like and HNH nuclease domain